MTQEVNLESLTTTRSTPLKHSQQPGYIYDSVRKRWVADTRDGYRICNHCKQRHPLDCFSGHTQKSHTCRKCRRYIKASHRYQITTEEAIQLYSAANCQCCGHKFDEEKYRQCIHHLQIGAEIVVRGVICKQCNWLLQDENAEHKQRLKSCLKFMDEDIV